jgi:hypothetical protein
MRPKARRASPRGVDHRARGAGLLVCVALASWADAPEAAGAGGLDVRRVDPKAAVKGAAISVLGSGLGGPGTQASVGGKRARVLSARAHELRIVVPSARPGVRAVIVSRGRSSSRGRLQVLRPFNGKVRARVDRRRASSATIGFGGGELTARGAGGVRYTLRVPPGALAVPTAISLTPVRRFGGLPFTGRGSLGVDFAPDGLKFATPATLEIRPKGRFPSKAVGFTYSNGGPRFVVQGKGRDRRVLKLTIKHFSSSGVAGTNPADFANAVLPLLVESPMQVSTVEALLSLISAYEEQFPPDFCITQPSCEGAVKVALQSLATRIQGRCTGGRQNAPTMRAYRDLIKMEALRRQLGAQGDLSAACRDGILLAILRNAKAAAGCGGVGGDPFGTHAAVVDISLDEGGTGDLDRDGEVTHLEFLFFLVGPLQLAGLNEQVEAQDCALAALRALPAAGKTLCASDRRLAERNLDRALDYAQALHEALNPYIEAFDFCRIGIAIAPTSVSVSPGGSQNFAATVTGVIDSNNEDVAWSASRGSIDSSGHYVAPSTAGADTVTVASALNPSRTASAEVTVAVPYDLTVKVTEEADPAESGTIGYGYEVTNKGPNLAPSVSLQIIPSIASGSPSCFSLETENRALGDIGSGETVTGNFELSCEGPGAVKVEMRATAGPGEATPADNVDSETTEILPPEGEDESNALQVTLLPPGGTINEGNSTWGIEVTASANGNPNDQAAEGVMVTFEVSYPKPCCVNWSTISCTTPSPVSLGDIAEGATKSSSFGMNCSVDDDGDGNGLANVVATAEGSDNSFGQDGDTQIYHNTGP